MQKCDLPRMEWNKNKCCQHPYYHKLPATPLSHFFEYRTGKNKPKTNDSSPASPSPPPPPPPDNYVSCLCIKKANTLDVRMVSHSTDYRRSVITKPFSAISIETACKRVCPLSRPTSPSPYPLLPHQQHHPYRHRLKTKTPHQQHHTHRHRHHPTTMYLVCVLCFKKANTLYVRMVSHSTDYRRSVITKPFSAISIETACQRVCPLAVPPPLPLHSPSSPAASSPPPPPPPENVFYTISVSAGLHKSRIIYTISFSAGLHTSRIIYTISFSAGLHIYTRLLLP